MKKYKIKYWNNGNICLKTVEATSVNEARYIFYMSTPCDDIISIEEVE